MKPHLRSSVLICLAASVAFSPPARAQPEISRAEIFDIAASGVGSPYVWGGGCWDPEDRSRLGADCSGYVAKCWQVPERSAVTTCSHPYSTYNFYHEDHHWDPVDRDDADAADAFVRRADGAGHIVLYVAGDPWGSFEVYEARGSAYGIVHRDRICDSSYRVRRRRSLIPDGPPPHPVLTLSVEIDSIDGQDRDLCRLGGSERVFDAYEGQTLSQRLFITNEGDEVAREVIVGVEVDAEFLSLDRYEIFSDWRADETCGSAFCLNDANDHPDNPPHDDPGGAVSFFLYSISSGETKMILLDLTALTASFAAGARPEVRLWVRQIEGWYAKDGYGSGFDNVEGLQTFNGGDLRARSQQDILAEERCNGLDDDCSGDVDEGFGLGEACVAGRGACQAEGTVICDDEGGARCDATPLEPSMESCNGVDDDCDGTIDEGCGEIPDPDAGQTDGGADGGPAHPAFAPASMKGGCACGAAGASTPLASWMSFFSAF